MALPPIIAEAAGAQTVKFSAPLANGKKVKLEALADPRALGFDNIFHWGTSGWSIKGLLVGDSAMNWTLAFGLPDDIPAVLEAWQEAAGLGNQGMLIARKALEYSTLVEADFQRFYHLDFREWLDLESSMTTRRMLTLLNGLNFKTDSLFWAEVHDLDPLSRSEILLANLASSQEKPHPWLTARKDRAAQREMQEKFKRIQSRGR